MAKVEIWTEEGSGAPGAAERDVGSRAHDPHDPDRRHGSEEAHQDPKSSEKLRNDGEVSEDRPDALLGEHLHRADVPESSGNPEHFLGSDVQKHQPDPQTKEEQADIDARISLHGPILARNESGLAGSGQHFTNGAKKILGRNFSVAIAIQNSGDGQGFVEPTGRRVEVSRDVQHHQAVAKNLI